jgi:hypothetical protein
MRSDPVFSDWVNPLNALPSAKLVDKQRRASHSGGAFFPQLERSGRQRQLVHFFSNFALSRHAYASRGKPLI